MDLSFLAGDTISAAKQLLGKYISTETDGIVTGGILQKLKHTLVQMIKLHMHIN
ncbi:hypothetical protein LAU42_09375 [Macrococcus armenti]|uniref:hypothetical protein n=1 Tax=Macrococcus armenti TaxID=2875764 RepID=UPI001CD00E99|nr:hypothetical protein [Macrococcus armenti]UBH21950.1 hypothetical protein LAU42_09375 [Macrococcus armenti]